MRPLAKASIPQFPWRSVASSGNSPFAKQLMRQCCNAPPERFTGPSLERPTPLLPLPRHGCCSSFSLRLSMTAMGGLKGNDAACRLPILEKRGNQKRRHLIIPKRKGDWEQHQVDIANQASGHEYSEAGMHRKQSAPPQQAGQTIWPALRPAIPSSA